MDIVEKKVTELREYENNPRKNDEAVQFVTNSIQEFGFRVPIIIDKNNIIIAGHTRLKAAKSLGMKHVPCIVADDLTNEQVRAFRLADNKTAELSSWDFELLDSELMDIVDIDMEKLGFLDINYGDIDEAIDELNEINETPTEKKPKTMICPYCGEEIEL